jgi:DNA polymerase elongation subunit (family B)
MSSPYRGSLSPEQRAAVDDVILLGTSVRGIAPELKSLYPDITYGQVRYYLDWKAKQPEEVPQPKIELSEDHLKVLIYDIETAPLLGHMWHTFGDFVGQDQLLGDTFMLTWAAKWYHDDKVLHDRLTGEEAKEQNDARIISSLAALIREADVVVAHNGDRFDFPTMNTRLALLKQEPIGPKTSIDTLKLSKKNFRFAKNTLDYLMQVFLGRRKIKTEFNLWRRAYQGDESALEEMDIYCRNDVDGLEGVFDAMRPYVQRLTRLVNGPGFQCPSCGSGDIQKRGFYRTQMSTYQKWWCNNCLRYSRSKVLAEKRSPLHPL